MRLSFLLYGVFLFSVAHATYDPHSYLKKRYNETISEPKKIVSKFLSTAFPDAYGHELLDFSGHFSPTTRSSNPAIIILPDLDNSVSTRASTIQYIQRNLQAGDAVLFVHDTVDPNSGVKKLPQPFGCKRAFLRAPKNITQREFEEEFWKQSLMILSKIRIWDDCQCFRLGLSNPSPAQIEANIDEIGSRELPPKRYFVIMDQRQMPGQMHAKHTKQDWDAAFGQNDYQMFLDDYVNTRSN